MTTYSGNAWLLCLIVICAYLLGNAQGDLQKTNMSCRVQEEDNRLRLSLNCTASNLASVIHLLQWKKIIIIYDQENEALLDHLMETSVMATPLVKLVTSEQAWSDRGLPASIALGAKGGQQRLQILLLCSQQSTADILHEATDFQKVKGQETAIRETTQWLLVLPLCPTSAFLPQIHNVTLNNLAVMTYLNDPPQGSNCCTPELHSLHLTSNGGNFVKVKSPLLCEASSSHDALFPNVDQGLNGRTLIITTVESASFLTKNSKGEYEGIGLLFLEALARFLNFTYTLVEVEDGEYGRLNESGLWNGMIGALHRKEADVALAELTPSLARSEVSDFTTPFSADVYTFCYRLPPADTSPALLFLKPFRWQVLMCFGFAAVGTVLLMYVLCLLSPCPRRPEKPYHVLDSLFLVMETALANSGTPIPHATPALVTLCAWALTCLVVAATYTGNLVAFLAVTKGPAPIASLQQLVSQRHYSWGLVNGSYIATVLATSTLPIFQKIWRGIEEFSTGDPGVLAPDIQTLMAKVARENFVAIDTEAWLLEHGAAMELPLQCSEEAILPGFVALALQNNSAYTDVVSNAILSVTESGVMEVWKRLWLKRYNFTHEEDSAFRQKPAGLKDTQMAFQGLLVGLGFAALVLVVEVLHTKLSKRSAVPLGDGMEMREPSQPG